VSKRATRQYELHATETLKPSADGIGELSCPCPFDRDRSQNRSGFLLDGTPMSDRPNPQPLLDQGFELANRERRHDFQSSHRDRSCPAFQDLVLVAPFVTGERNC